MTATMKRLVVLVLIFAMLSTAVPVVLADEGEGHNAFVSADEPTEPGGSYTLVSDPDDVHGSTEVVAYIETATFPTLSDFDLTDGTPVEAIPPTSLREGEIWAGKAVAYHDNGTATITLLAWGSTWGGDQMPLDEGNRYVTIIDNIGEFRVDEAALPLGVVAGPNNTVIWNVVETDIIEPEPAYVSFIVYLCEDEPREARWYATGFASVRFYPARGNPFYWTQEEVTHNAFEMSMNWNNGAGSGGLNEGTITDNILNIDIYFGTNHNSPENQRVADAIFPTHWNTTVGPEGQRLYWHLDWIRTNIAKTYIFTVRGLEANGVDIAYEIIFPRGGGNESHPGSRTLVSTEYFRRHFVSGNPDLPFTWDNGAIVYDLEVAAQIRLQSPPPIVLPVGTLQVNKVLAGEFEKDWDVGAETPFQAILKNQDGLYLTFQAGAEVNQYIYAGFVSERALATVITFSVAHPAVITEMPVYAAASTPPIRYFVEEIFEVETNLIQVSYSFDEDGFTIAGGEGRTQVTVTNTYQHGVGYFVVRKRLDGFAKDWGVNHDTVFYVRIWDVERENYLLFKDYPEPDGTFQRIGNHVFGLTEDYQGLPVMELPVSVNQPLHLSYLWTWGKYEVREVRRTTTNSIEKEWVAFWNHTDLDRDPTFQNRPDGVWTDGLWLRETWLGHWEYVDEITCIDTWHEDDDWVWGAAYSENNGVRELQFNETITVTVTNRYKYSSGNMTIAKELAGSPEDWGINERTLFHANIWAIRDPANPGDRVALIFEEMHQAHGDVVFRNIGYIDGAGVPEFYYPQDAGIDFLRRIPFSVTSPALVVGLPAYGGHYYFVEEFFEDGVVTDHITTSYILNGEPISADGVQIAAETNNSFVVHVRNDYDYGRSNLVIVKELDGFPGNWEVDEFTQFFAGVREEGTDTYLHFALQVDGSFLHIPAGAAYTGETVWIIPFSAANPVIITGLPITGLFVVDELCEEGNDIYNKFSTGFTVIVEHDRTNFAVGGNMIATVTNRFEHGTGTLIIEKELANAPPFITDGDWFFASVRDATDSTYLRFVLVDEETNTWRSVGNDLDWIAEHVKEEVYEEIRFSVNRPATLINLWSGRIYVINEGPGDYTSVHEPLRIMQNGDVLTSRIINEFPTFTVTYDGNGNTAGVPPVDAEEYPVGAEVTVLGPNDLAKDGYHFLGWNTAPDGTGDWHQPDDTFQMPAANVTLYAQWERDVEPPPTFTVTYDGNGNTAGVPPVDEEEYLADADVTVLGRNNLVKDGYHFLGWNTAPDGTGDWHQPDDTFQMPAANVTLYAQWERDAEPPPTFTVTYDGNGNTAGVPPVDAEEYPVGAEVTVLGRNNLVKDGYHFLGWNTAPDGTGDWHQPDDTLQMPAANVTLYAQWERNAEPPPTFRVFYNGNGHTAGTAPIDAVAYLPGTSVVVLGPNNLVKDGYRFIGWNTSPNGTGTWRQPGERFQMPAANVTLYAQWEPEEEALQRQAYMIGRPDGLIHPRDNITRAEIATIFFRLITDEMREEYWTQTHPFSDVRLGNWFNNAVATTTNMGLFRGVREGYFAPHQAITRGELAAVMARFFPAAELGPFAAGEDMFRDIADHWAREYINFAAENGWVEGPEGIGGPFNPSIPITRAETAAMVNRIFKRLLECPQGLHPDMLTWPDNSNEESWYFLHKKAATNSYTYEWLECGVYKTWTSTIEPRDWSVLERPNSRPEDIHG